MDPVAVRIEDACRAIGISRSSPYELIGEGRLDAIKIAGRTLVTTDSIRSLVKSAPKADIGNQPHKSCVRSLASRLSVDSLI